MKPKLLKRLAALALVLAALPLLAAQAAGDKTAAVALAAKQGDTLTVTLELAEPGSVAAARCGVGYDPAKLTLQSAQVAPAAGSDLAQSQTSYKAVNPKTSQVKMLWYSLDTPYTGGPLLTLTFTAAADFTETSLTLSGLELADAAGAPLTPAGASFTVANQNSLPGDADGSGEVDMNDMIALQMYIAGLYTPPVPPALLELTGDGDVDMNDLIALQMGIAGLIPLESASHSGSYPCV